MNNKYNSNFDLKKFKCVDNKIIVSLEEKINNSFCIDDTYDYGYNLL